jgi:hypothetical protein
MIIRKTLKTSLKLAIIIALAISTTMKVNAQFSIGGAGTNGSGINANGTTNGTPTVPFDSNMSIILFGIGILYGSKKLTKLKLGRV